jgi:hypothetical protein
MPAAQAPGSLRYAATALQFGLLSRERFTKQLLNFAGTLSSKIEIQARNRYLLDVRGYCRCTDWPGLGGPCPPKPCRVNSGFVRRSELRRARSGLVRGAPGFANEVVQRRAFHRRTRALRRS